MKVRIHHNGDDVLVAWKPDGFIAGCRGFALLRRRNGVEEVVSTWVGFEDDKAADGERRASTNWPIQKYQWTDYMANPGDRLAYRVLAMVGPDKANLKPDPASASEWTPEVTLSHTMSAGIEVVFNRGIVASQWVSRRLGTTDHDLQNARLTEVIATPGDRFRDYLAGPLGERLFTLLDTAVKRKQQVYAALYELDDPQLIAALIKLGDRGHVVLANGSVKKKGGDQNAEARAAPPDDLAPRAGPQQVPGRVRCGRQRQASMGVDRQPELDQDRVVHAGQQLGADRRPAAGGGVPQPMGSTA
jgi:hypothetical protein